MHLLDTNVLSELRKLPTGRADQRVRAWAEQTDREANFLSVMTILEVETGILRLERYDSFQAAHLRRWLSDIVLPDFGKRIFDVDIEIAIQAAALHVPNPRSSHDALIAATAKVKGLTLATRNVGDFVGAGVRVVNPWDD